MRKTTFKKKYTNVAVTQMYCDVCSKELSGDNGHFEPILVTFPCSHKYDFNENDSPYWEICSDKCGLKLFNDLVSSGDFWQHQLKD